MADDRAKPDEAEHRIDPSLKKEDAPSRPPSAQPVSQTGVQRRENQTPANYEEDGQRKRAEEGL